MDNLGKRTVFADSRQIEKVVANLATNIRRDYLGKTPLVIGVLKGSFIFLADLVRKLGIEVEIDFIGLSSYGRRRVTSGTVSLYCEPRIEVAGKDIILVEDIVDSGHSTIFAINYFKQRGAASVKLCALLDKQDRRAVDINIDYVGLIAPEGFLVGYGLDCDEKFRNLREIIVLGEE